MGFMDKFMGSVEKAKEEVSDFAETTRLKREIGRLNDRKSELFAEVGRQVDGLYGRTLGGFDFGVEVPVTELVPERALSFETGLKGRRDSAAPFRPIA